MDLNLGQQKKATTEEKNFDHGEMERRPSAGGKRPTQQKKPAWLRLRHNFSKIKSAKEKRRKLGALSPDPTPSETDCLVRAKKEPPKRKRRKITRSTFAFDDGAFAPFFFHLFEHIFRHSCLGLSGLAGLWFGLGGLLDGVVFQFSFHV